MNRIVVDTSVLSKLDNLTSAMELCNEGGVTLGYFVPAADRQREVYEWAQGAFSEEEIDAARQQPGGITTEELLGRLGRFDEIHADLEAARRESTGRDLDGCCESTGG